MQEYAQGMELLALIGIGAIVSCVVSLARAWGKSGRNLEDIRRRNAAKPSSWEGSAEQSMLHSAGEMHRWTSDRPY